MAHPVSANCYNGWMITTLTGDNSFGLQHALRQRIAAFVEVHGDLALERLDGAEADIARITEAVTSLPFLATQKLVVLRSPSSNKKFVETAEQLMGEVPETTDVIIVEPKLDKRLAYYKFLKKQADFQEFKALDAQGLARWLSGESKARGGTLNVSDAHYLVERVGTDQQLLANELEKLLLRSTKISRDTINELTEAAPQSTIFQLLEAAFAGNHRQLLILYAEQRAQKVEPQQIIAMLAWQLHILALVKTAGDRSADQIAKEAKLSPFVVRKSQTIARKLSLGELKRLVANLLTIDSTMKSAAIDADDALQHFLLKLS